MPTNNYYYYRSVPTQKKKTLRFLGQFKITLFVSRHLAGLGHLPGESIRSSEPGAKRAAPLCGAESDVCILFSLFR